MYLRINQDGSIRYPYNLEELRSENPNTSFFDVIPIETLLNYNVHVVYPVGRGSDYTKNYTEGTPQLINGQYFQNWIVTDATQEEIEERLDVQWNQIKLIRNQYLSQSDWTQLQDSPLTIEEKNKWMIYRQNLRNVINQNNPFDIIWPTVPANK
jgi:hypothetical protein